MAELIATPDAVASARFARSTGRLILSTMPRKCSECGTSFQTSRRTQRCCSAPCGRKAAGRSRTVIPPRACKVCGVTFKQRTISGSFYLNGRMPQFCSRRCAAAQKRFDGAVRRAETAAKREYAKMRERDTAPSLRCIQCGKTIDGQKKKFCNRKCCTKWNTDLARKPVVRKACDHCGKIFEKGMRGGAARKCCSSKCSDAAASSNHNARRRAQEMGSKTERVSRFDIFARDGWRCKICGKKTLRSKRFPHPMSATLDHIVPLAAGGSHTADNLQCACNECNYRKAAGLGGQPFLPGMGCTERPECR
jgi:hypothetical protein